MPKYPDQEYWDRLQTRKARVADSVRTIKYDPETGKSFNLDANGEWTGEVFQSKPAQNQEAEAAADEKNTEQPPQAKPMTLTANADTPHAAEDSEKKEENKPGKPETPPIGQEQPAASPKDHAAEQGETQVIKEEDKENTMESKPKHKTNDKNATTDKKKPIGILIFAGLLILVVAVAVLLSNLGGQDNSELPDSTESPINTESAYTPTEAHSPSSEAMEGKTIYVLSASKPLIPGHPITRETFEQTGVTEFEYRQLTVSEGLFTADDLETMEGLTIIKYIPAGKYISYSDVGHYEPTNPWAPEGAAYVTIPVEPCQEDLVRYMWGTTIDISVSVRTQQNTDNPTEVTESTTPEGVEHESSVLEQMVRDTYKLQNITVRDVLGADGNSLFTRYSAISEIPSVFQQTYLTDSYADRSMLMADLPAHLVLCVTAEQANLINSLPLENLTVTITSSVPLEQTALQMDTYNDLQQVLKAIAPFLAEPEEIPEGDADA